MRSYEVVRKKQRDLKDEWQKNNRKMKNWLWYEAGY